MVKEGHLMLNNILGNALRRFLEKKIPVAWMEPKRNPGGE